MLIIKLVNIIKCMIHKFIIFRLKHILLQKKK